MAAYDSESSMSSDVSSTQKFDPGLGIHFDPQGFQFTYDVGVFGPPKVELRRLDAIRASLHDPQCSGPDPVYAIAMGVGRDEHIAELKRRMLLYGVVAYAKGRLGNGPVRSQGHIHAIAPHCGWSTPELVEIWEGKAIVYLQKVVADDPEYCVAIEAGPGDLVVIPPSWAHCIINADPESEMVFGAFCDREYAFVYDDVRRRGGLAWFAQFGSDNKIEWVPNPAYSTSALTVRSARNYPEFRLDGERPIYEQFATDPKRLQWVSEPAIYADLWENFQP
jgi:glucose-6-phosphate isomerase, archaeal